MFGRRREGAEPKASTHVRRTPGLERKRYVIIGAVAGAIIVAAGVVVAIKLNGTTPSGHPPDAAQPSASPAPNPAAGIPPATPAQAANVPSSRPDEAGLTADFPKLQSAIDGSVGIAIAPAGNGTAPVVLGQWIIGPAWSTMKVPLVIAALRQPGQGDVTDAMRAAITKSDNDAAESIWKGLSDDPATAAHTVEKVLLEAGDHTTVQSQRIRTEFTAFGQTIWPLADQVRFAAYAACDPGDAKVRELMGQVEQDQRWGLGTIPNTQFKGGWGPSTEKKYLVRQFGFIANPTSGAVSAVAVAVDPTSGSFDDGTADLNKIADWLKAHSAVLPAGQCGH
jgi:hypothetical protein